MTLIATATASPMARARRIIALPAEDGEHEPSVRCGGVAPCVADGAEGCARLGHVVEHVEQVAGAARQTVEAGDEEDIAGPEHGE
jgi:hypothetical protein